MRKFVATLVLLLFLSPSVYSQISIDKESRVPNRSPGYCTWACLETLGRYHKIEALYNLVDNRSKEFTWEWDGKQWIKSPYVWVNYGNYKSKVLRSPGGHAAITNKLDSLKIKYLYQDYYNYDKTLIKEAVKNKKGCMVVVKWWLDDNGKALQDSSDTHAIIILDYDEKGITFFDPNDVESIYKASHNWFNHYWIGYTLVIDK